MRVRNNPQNFQVFDLINKLICNHSHIKLHPIRVFFPLKMDRKTFLQINDIEFLFRKNIIMKRLSKVRMA